MNNNSSSASAYAAAGVDTAAGERAVELMKQSVAAATRSEAIGSLGGFAGLFDASALSKFRKPLLATSTDGVGTKVAVAQRMDVHDTIGIDLVAMVVDDLVVCGAVKGIADGCQLAGCALLGGETAEHPGLLEADEYDVAGAGTGVVEADQLLGPLRVKVGDRVIAMRSSGLHSNGYSLARNVLLTKFGWELDRDMPDFGRTLGEELLVPTRIYTRDCLDLVAAENVDVHAYSHVTGGGIAANLARVLPEMMHVDIDRGTWTPQPVFATIGSVGSVPNADLELTFNMGVGMFAIVSPETSDRALEFLAARQVDSWICGTVRKRQAGEVGDAEAKGGGGGSVSLVNSYA